MVLMTDSDISELAAPAASINRRSGRFSAQNDASDSSLSKSGTSSHVVIEFISRTTQGLIHFALIKKLLLRLERSGVDNPDRLPVGPIHREDSSAPGRDT